MDQSTRFSVGSIVGEGLIPAISYLRKELGKLWFAGKCALVVGSVREPLGESLDVVE
ncbi:MAG: hypothetical protein QM488_20020 [Rhizobiaceae bacterium]